MNEFNIHIYRDIKEHWYLQPYEEIKKRKPTVVNFFGVEEYDFVIENQNLILKNPIFENFFLDHNIRANFFLGIAEVDHFYQNPSKNRFLFLDPIYQFRRSFRCYAPALYHTRPDFFRFDIMSLNYKDRHHRRNLINELKNRELINDNNAISHHFRNDNNNRFSNSRRFRRLDSEVFNFTNKNQWNVPTEWFSSFLHVVSETCDDIIFITEKTCAPLLGGKLFICQAAQHFHKKLEELGFLLYSEIINYEFDNESNASTRLNKMLDEVEKIIKLPNHEQIYNDLHKKILFNQKHAISLALDKPTDIPESFINFYQNNIARYY